MLSCLRKDAMASIRIYSDEVKALPMVCAKCGESAECVIPITFTGHHSPWCALLVLVPGAHLLMAFEKKVAPMTVHLPFCNLHKNYFRTQDWLFERIVWGGGLAALAIGAGALFLGAKAGGSENLGIGAWILIFSVVAWLFAIAVITSIGIRPSKITRRSITLTNVSSAFADAVHWLGTQRGHAE
jgi:hypothetical protein